MNPFTRRILLPALLFITMAAQANSKSTSPFFFTLFNVSFLDLNTPTAKAEKICACQLLDVKSNNESIQNLVVLAEKTSQGNFDNEQTAILEVLKKERKEMQSKFYSAIKTKLEFVMATDCETLYRDLSKIYDNLKLYEVVDADVRLALKK